MKLMFQQPVGTIPSITIPEKIKTKMSEKILKSAMVAYVYNTSLQNMKPV